MPRKSVVEPIYNQYKFQIDTIVSLMDYNYNKATKIIEWLYGGRAETWRKMLRSKKVKEKVPPEIKEFFKKFKTK